MASNTSRRALARALAASAGRRAGATAARAAPARGLASKKESWLPQDDVVR